MSQPTADITLVVGLDIGTVFSGLAFQLQRDGEAVSELREVRGWPCPPGHAREADQVKVPTKIDYANTSTSDQGTDSDDEHNSHLWGYLVVDDNDTMIEWPKLLLLDTADLPSYLRDSAQLRTARRRMSAMHKTPIEIIADYITQLWKHAVGYEETEGYIDRFLLPPLRAATMRTHIVVTIPAIWKNSAVQAMKKALNNSILGSERISFEFMSEPEAGMMALAGQIKNQMQVDDVAVCLDLGGGTADCISYKLTSIDRLVWEEVVPGDGALCGAMFLDEAFQKVLEGALLSSEQPTTAEGWKALLRTEWEHSIKRDFDFAAARLDGSRRINLSTVTDQSIAINNQQLRDAFDSITTQILKLVQRQADDVKSATGGRAPKAILVVGGFGRCPYIRGALNAKFGGGGGRSSRGPKRARTAVDNGIHILSDTGELPWAAICRGAVLAKLKDNARIESRKARFSFGFVQSVVASPEEGGVWNNLFGSYMITDTMTWVLHRGDSIRASDKILQQTLAFSTSQTQQPYHEATFYAHPGEEPPMRFVRRDRNFQEWGSISIHVPASLDQLPLREDDAGGRSHVFDYDLHINSKGESINIVAYSAETGEKVGELLLKDLA